MAPEAGDKEWHMSTKSVTQRQVLEELQGLEPSRWFKVFFTGADK
jgi:hypothetical protein